MLVHLLFPWKYLWFWGSFVEYFCLLKCQKQISGVCSVKVVKASRSCFCFCMWAQEPSWNSCFPDLSWFPSVGSFLSLAFIPFPTWCLFIVSITVAGECAFFRAWISPGPAPEVCFSSLSTSYLLPKPASDSKLRNCCTWCGLSSLPPQQWGKIFVSAMAIFSGRMVISPGVN